MPSFSLGAGDDAQAVVLAQRDVVSLAIMGCVVDFTFISVFWGDVLEHVEVMPPDIAF